MRAPILLIAILISACSTEPEDDEPQRTETARQDTRCAPGGVWTVFSWGEGCAYPDIKPTAPGKL